MFLANISWYILKSKPYMMLKKILLVISLNDFLVQIVDPLPSGWLVFVKWDVICKNFVS